MEVRRSLLLSGLLALTIGIIFLVSWSDVLESTSFQTLPRLAVQLWGPSPTEDPDLTSVAPDLTSVAPDLTSVAPDLTSVTTEPPGLTPVPLQQFKDFKELPDFAFGDEYKTDRQPSKSTQNCEGSLWNTIKQDPEMSKKFIANIRMFVHNGSISMTEFNRLSNFNKPYGFMSYSYKDVVPALNLIPKLEEPLLPPKPGKACISCAAVGNGGILWRSKKGREIDSHDYVIRVNAAAIEGFEEDVGSRTDVYVHTGHSINSGVGFYKRFGYKHAPADKGMKYVLIPEAMRDLQWLTGLYKTKVIPQGMFKGKRPWLQYSGNFDKSRFYVLHMDFLRLIRNRFFNGPNLKGKYWMNYRPTNGAFMLFVALQVCDQVDAYGFMTENYKNYSHYYYQRQDTSKHGFWRSHNYTIEMMLWKQLHDLKIIKLYQGKA